MGLTRVKGGGIQPTILDPIQNLYTGSTVVFTVTVASKDTTHRYNGQGSSNGYKIDGKFAPFLVLTPGVTYKFDQADGSNSGHPLRFYKDAAKVTAYTTNVTTNGTAGSSGAYTQIVTGDATPTILYYQCSAHGFMGNAIQTNGLASSVPDDGAITTAKLADDAVNNDKLANSVVAEIAANTAKTSNATHTGDVTGSTSLTIANNAVTTAKINDQAVTTGKLANNAVDYGKLADGAVLTSKIANNAVQTAKIVDEAVTLAKLPHGTGSNDGKFLRANNGADPSFESIPAGVGGSNGVDFNNSVRARFGTNNDLSLFHDGSNAVLQNNTGDIYIENDSSSTGERIYIRPKAGEASINCLPNGEVELYYDNSKKLETAAHGITVTGRARFSQPYAAFYGVNNASGASGWKTLQWRVQQERRTINTSNSISRFTPQQAGWYLVVFNHKHNNGAHNNYYLRILRNSTINWAYRQFYLGSNGNISAVMYFNGSSDYFEMATYHGNSSHPDDNSEYTNFSAIYLTA